MSTSVSESLNGLLADSTVFYQKLRHYHWNVTGPGFFELHQKFEEVYNRWNVFIDEVAERVIALDSIPLHTLVQVLDQAHLQEHSLEVHLPFLQMVLDDFCLIPTTS